MRILVHNAIVCNGLKRWIKCLADRWGQIREGTDHRILDRAWVCPFTGHKMACLSIKSTADDADTSNCELNVAWDRWVLEDHWVLDESWPALASTLLLWGMWTEEPLIPMRNQSANHVTVPWLSAPLWSEQCTLGPYFGLIVLSQTKTGPSAAHKGVGTLMNKHISQQNPK